MHGMKLAHWAWHLDDQLGYCVGFRCSLYRCSAMCSPELMPFVPILRAALFTPSTSLENLTPGSSATAATGPAQHRCLSHQMPTEARVRHRPPALLTGRGTSARCCRGGCWPRHNRTDAYACAHPLTALMLRLHARPGRRCLLTSGRTPTSGIAAPCSAVAPIAAAATRTSPQDVAQAPHRRRRKRYSAVTGLHRHANNGHPAPAPDLCRSASAAPDARASRALPPPYPCGQHRGTISPLHHQRCISTPPHGSGTSLVVVVGGREELRELGLEVAEVAVALAVCASACVVAVLALRARAARQLAVAHRGVAADHVGRVGRALAGACSRSCVLRGRSGMHMAATESGCHALEPVVVCVHLSGGGIRCRDSRDPGSCLMHIICLCMNSTDPEGQSCSQRPMATSHTCMPDMHQCAAAPWPGHLCCDTAHTRVSGPRPSCCMHAAAQP